jgi:Peptidase A4 family
MKPKLVLLTIAVIATLAIGVLVMSRSNILASQSGSENSAVLSSQPAFNGHTMLPGAALSSATTSAVSCPLPAAECFASYNWGGYAVCPSSCASGTAGQVTDVKGTWTVPSITGQSGNSCPNGDKTWYDSSVWIGIDGFNDTTVEQTGTSVDCYYGHVYYYAWYEFYPAVSYNVPITVHPGDKISAEVSYANKMFTTKITDLTTGQSYSKTVKSNPADLRNSAEWIVESAFTNLGELALTKTSQISFTSGSATIAGTTHQMSGWGKQLEWILEVNQNFGFNEETGVPTPSTENLANSKANPSAISDNAFTVTWLSYGP